MKEYPLTFTNYTTAAILQRICSLLGLEKLGVITKIQLLTKSEIDSILTCEEVRNFLVELKINDIEKIIYEYEVTNTCENLDRFLDTFDELFKKVDFLSKKSNTLAALYNHDIRDSIQYLYPASYKEGRHFIIESLGSEELKNLTTAGKKFIAFLESLYFVFQIPKEILMGKKKNTSLREVLKIAQYQIKPFVLINLREGVENFGVKGDFIILLANIFRNSEKHGQANCIEVSLERENILVIKDNGVGIPQEVIPLMFDSGVSGAGSSGLGLRNLKERGFDIKASNNGLPNKNGGYGAKIEIQFSNKK